MAEWIMLPSLSALLVLVRQSYRPATLKPSIDEARVRVASALLDGEGDGKGKEAGS